jgi:D-glycero-D-manno-heptose 1,7-bisphosphate phosphatase
MRRRCNPYANRRHLMRKALFLDRDGVINIDRDFVSRIEDFEWSDGIFELVAAARAADYLPIVITNQSGIGRGFYSEDDFERLTDWMCGEFRSRGAAIERVYHGPFHPDAVHERYRADHPWRKPKPGMIFAARDEFSLDLGASALIGDRWSDIEAGLAAGVGTNIVIGSALAQPLPIAHQINRLESVADAQRFLFGASGIPT